MATSKLVKFVLAITLQVAIILSIIIFKISILTGGTEVFLRIEPIDPTSPLRGDYATFRYNISTIDPGTVGNTTVKNGDTVYVVLTQSGNYWKAKSVSLNLPSDKSQTFIKGKVISGGQETQAVVFPTRRTTGSLQIVYGVEEYFIPEGAGRSMSFAGKEVLAKVAVDEAGNAALKQVLVDGKNWP